jgi:large subunit ribosomal protein L7/L12
MQLFAGVLTCFISFISARRVQHIESEYAHPDTTEDSKVDLLKMFLFAPNSPLGGRTLKNNFARTPSTRMDAAVDEIMEKLKDLTLLEAAELVTAIEDTFGVDASASSGGGMMMAMPAGGGGGAAAAEEVVEKTTFDLVLDSFEDKKIPMVKVVKDLLGLGIKEAKELVDKAPVTLLEGAPKAECEKGLEKIEAAGGKASMK